MIFFYFFCKMSEDWKKLYLETESFGSFLETYKRIEQQ